MSNINDILIYELNKGEQVAFSGKLPNGTQSSQSTTTKILSNPNSRSLYGKDVDKHMAKHNITTNLLKVTNIGKKVGGFFGSPGISTVSALNTGGPAAAVATMGAGSAVFGASKLADRAIKHHLVNSLTKSNDFKNLKHNEIGSNSSLQNQHQLTNTFHNIFNKHADNSSSIVRLAKLAKSHITPELPHTVQTPQSQLKSQLLQKHRPPEPDVETKIANKTGELYNTGAKIASGVGTAIKSKLPNAIKSKLPNLLNLSNHPSNIYQK